jgi:hypothetical protein
LFILQSPSISAPGRFKQATAQQDETQEHYSAIAKALKPVRIPFESEVSVGLRLARRRRRVTADHGPVDDKKNHGQIEPDSKENHGRTQRSALTEKLY